MGCVRLSFSETEGQESAIRSTLLYAHDVPRSLPHTHTLSLCSDMSERNKNPHVNKRNLVEIVRANEGSEFLAYYPTWTAGYNKTKEAYEKLVAVLENNPPTMDGELAEKCAAVLSSGKTASVRTFLADFCPIDLLVATLEDLTTHSEAEMESEAKEGVELSKKEESKKPAPEVAAPEPIREQRKKKQGAPVNPFALLQNE